MVYHQMENIVEESQTEESASQPNSQTVGQLRLRKEKSEEQRFT